MNNENSDQAKEEKINKKSIQPNQFLFYDTETSGLDHTSQILQYGAIITDSDFNEIRRVEKFSLPRPDAIPAIGAYLTHNIPLSKIIENGVPEPQFAREVFDDMTQDSNTCVTGYNSHKFDDNRVRELFYRNNVDPYKREYASQNSRFDVFKMLKAVYAFKPDTLKWPEPNEDGYVPMKLEKIAPLNDVVQIKAHDAMSDVEATIGVAKIVKEKEPRLFHACLDLRDKSIASGTTYNKPFLLVGEHTPQSRMYTCAAMPLISHPSNKNSTICLDLSRTKKGDVDRILSIPPSELREHIFSSDFEDRLPLFEVRHNQLPMVFPLSLLKSPEVAERVNMSFEDCSRKALAIKNDARMPSLQLHVQEGYRDDMPKKDDVYGQLFNGFVQNHERTKLNKMSPSNYHEWVGIADSVSDSRIKPLTVRAIGNLDKELLNDSDKASFDQWMTDRYNDVSGKYGTTLPEFWADAKVALESDDTTPEQKTMVKEIVEYVDYYAQVYAKEMYDNKLSITETVLEDRKIALEESQVEPEPKEEKKVSKKKSSPSPSM